MPAGRREPKVYRILRGDAESLRDSPTGTVGSVYSGREVEVVWVSKEAEAIDTNWFRMSTVDLLLVLQGRLRVDFEEERFASQTLAPGDLLVLPPRTNCRAYRFPRSARRATIFLAAYPKVRRTRGGHVERPPRSGRRRRASLTSA